MTRSQHPASRRWPAVPRRRVGAAVLALLCLAVAGLSACSSAPAAARLGGPAPDFSLPGVDGSTVRLADYQGKPVVLNFWATWCAPCREEMPLIEEVYGQYRDRGLAVLAVNMAVNMEEDERVVRRWVEQGGYTLTFVRDTDGTQVKRYNVNSAPTTYFVAPDGTIRDVKFGAVTRADLETKIERLFGAG